MSDPGTHDPFQDTPPRPTGWKLTPRTRLLAAIAASAVAVMAILVWAGYELGKSQRAGEPPVVKAPEGAEKVRPEDPGGIYFEHQDKTVYGTFDGRDEEVEQLLPPAEEPMSKPEPALPAPEDADVDPRPPSANGDAAPSAMPEVTAGNTGDSKPDVSRKALPPPPLPVPEAVTDPVTSTPQQQPEKTIPKSPLPMPAAPAIEADPPAGGDYAVQLGAFRTAAAAEAGWKLLSGKHAGQLGQLSHYVVPVELGEKGRLYRLQAGPFASRAQADEKCPELKRLAVDCLAVRR